MVKADIERLYTSKFTTFEYVKERDKDGISSTNRICVHSDIPCKLSYDQVRVASSNEGYYSTSQEIKIFCNPDIEIKPGTEIEVLHLNKVLMFTCSGEPRLYPYHQEVKLTVCKEA